MNHPTPAFDEQKVLNKFLEENTLFCAPDPLIMTDHRIAPRSKDEEAIFAAGMDVHLVNEVRGRLIAALDESNTMIEQMGAAPGAKWGDIVAAIFTNSGDLSMIAPHGVVGFAGACHYPIKFIMKYWENDPTVGVREGDGFIHNDARYGGIHNTDQSTIMPLFWKGRRIAWISATIHEGENGSCEPGGMPAAAESKYDEGLKMSPFKVIENFKIRRDLQTFLQNSVRDPKLQFEDMKVKLVSVMRLRERVLKILEEFGEAALIGTLRKNLEDVATEVKRRIKELPDGTTRVVAFPDSTLRENVLMKFNMSITVKGEKMTFDMRGSAPEILNRSINTNLASFKTMIMSGLLQNIWPDLPQTLSVISPMDFLFDEKSLFNGSFETPQAMSLIPLFKTMTIPCIPIAKLGYMLPHRYTSIIAPGYDQPATFIYGGLTQHKEQVGNFCADINGNGQGARANSDGEHSVSPPFAAMCDIGEMELVEEEIPIVRLGAFTLAKDRVGFGKHRGGLGYEQIVTSRKSDFWGFMSGCTGSIFPSTQPLFGGYGSPAYPLCKIRGINVFNNLNAQQDNINFDIIDLMNNQPIAGGIYSSNDMGMTFELVQSGEVYMICQGSGGGYGDVLLRQPNAVAKDMEDDLISHETALDIYKVVIDPQTLVVDEQATTDLRASERRSRIARGVPFDEFVKTWSTEEPPTHIPYFGCWGNQKEVYGEAMGQRVKMSGDALMSMFMLNPKDVKIAALEAENARLRALTEGNGRGK